MEKVPDEIVKMEPIRIELPESYIYETVIPVRITDLNYVGHVGNDSFLSIVHEARAGFLKAYGYSELDVEGVGTIVKDAALVYKSQAHYGDELLVKVALVNPGYVSCDFKYLLLNNKTGQEVARAKTGFVFLDYETNKIMEMPVKFRALFKKNPR